MTTVSAAALVLAAGIGPAMAQQQQQQPAQQEQQRMQQQGQQQQGQQAQQQQQECVIGQQGEQDLTQQVQSAKVRRDLRTLRDAGLLLKEYDKQQACQQVVTAIQDIARTSGPQATAQQQGQQQQAQQQMSEEQRTQQRMQQAQPAPEAARRIGVDRMLGGDIVGANGDVMGEVSDIVLSAEGKPQYVVATFGGFLGVGEDRIAIPFDMLRIRMPQEQDEVVTFYVPMSEQQLTNAPRIEQEQNWQQNEQWQSKNRQYYDQNRQKT